MKRTVVLAILDGWGIGRNDNTNPIHTVSPEVINYLAQNYLSGALQASGIAVGLPWGEEGNSEVGHITLGAGKVIYQHYPRISLTIRDKTFFKNEVLKSAFDHALKNKTAVNLIGLLTSGNVHASFEHLEALIVFAKSSGVSKLNLHLITDGKDSPPKSAAELLQKLNQIVKNTGLGNIGSISGRYYGLDRDLHYDRTKKCYDAITGHGKFTEDPIAWLNKNYSQDLGDEFIEPVTISPDYAMREDDSIIFFNYREDSMRQISAAFAGKSFKEFTVINTEKFFTVSFTKYSPEIDIPAAFPADIVKTPLGKVLSDAQKIQLRVAETEKYAHVTYFFNGLHDEIFKNEYRVLIPSKNIAHPDEEPDMMTEEIASRVSQAVNEGGTDFILVNFASPDVVAHTGNFEAAMETVRGIDAAMRRLVEVCLKNNAVLVVTSDHGNIEQMANPLTGAPESAHNPNPVPIYIVGREFVSIKSVTEMRKKESEVSGILSDVAPTILEIMQIPKPADMTGESLIGKLS